MKTFVQNIARINFKIYKLKIIFFFKPGISWILNEIPTGIVNKHPCGMGRHKASN